MPLTLIAVHTYTYIQRRLYEEIISIPIRPMAHEMIISKVADSLVRMAEAKMDLAPLAVVQNKTLIFISLKGNLLKRYQATPYRIDVM